MYVCISLRLAIPMCVCVCVCVCDKYYKISTVKHTSCIFHYYIKMIYKSNMFQPN
jgi:hypothetical protein